MKLSPELQAEFDRIMQTEKYRVNLRASLFKIESNGALFDLQQYMNRSLGQVGRQARARIQRHRRELRA